MRVGNGQKGRQIDQVVTVDESTAEAPGALDLEAQEDAHRVARLAAIEIGLGGLGDADGRGVHRRPAHGPRRLCERIPQLGVELTTLPLLVMQA